MTRARNLADLLDANGDVKSTNLDNVPASDNASALTSGTLPNARLPANISDSGTTGTKVAVGTTAQRGTTQGEFRFNSTTGKFEGRNATSFVSIEPAPTISSVDDTEVDSAAGGNQTFVITGTNFAAGDVASFIGNDSSEITATTTTINSATQITAVIAKSSFANAKEPYDIKITTASGTSGSLADQINVDNNPTWSTSSGSLGTINDSARTGVSLSATAADADGDTITYSVQSGSLPGGLSLNTSTGAITGNANAVGSDTTSSFTLRATANSKTVDRAFTILIKAPQSGETILTYTGSHQSWSVPAGVSSVNFVMWGAGAQGGNGASGGFGTGTINLSGISTLAVVVGGKGASSGHGGSLSGIFNGSVGHGNSIAIVGGGGGGSENNSHGGYGGALNSGGGSGGVGRQGSPAGGGGSSSGGAGSNNAGGGNVGQAGSALQGGHAPTYGTTAAYFQTGRSSTGGSPTGSPGGTGGSGYYGGGGGSDYYATGGGGGSGYANTSIVSNIAGTNGNNGSGTSPGAAVGTGNSYYVSNIGSPGYDGRVVIYYSF